MIPGLESAELLRYGVMHRNTYINSPKLMSRAYNLRSKPEVFFAGQMTGVEGYVESTASGWLAGVNAARLAMGKEVFLPDDTTIIGSMAGYISSEAVENFQPMNANFGLIAPLDHKVKGGKAARNEAYAARSLAKIDEMKEILL